jgi:hypothetical protein
LTAVVNAATAERIRKYFDSESDPSEAPALTILN